MDQLTEKNLKLVSDSQDGEPSSSICKSKAISYIEDWISDKSIQYLLSGEIKLEGNNSSLDYISSLIFLEAKKDDSGGVTKELLRNYFSVWSFDCRKTLIKSLIASLQFSKVNNSIEIFINAVTGSLDNVDLAVIKHWIANCKRKLQGLKVKDHIMPIFYGKTGGGKSVAIQKLVSPIQDLTMEAPLSFVNDSRNDFNFTEKLVIIFDELSRANKTDMSSLKQRITSPYIESRKLGSSKNYKGLNITNFLGASNSEVKDIIQDPTSARRFYQVNCLNLMDWEAINSIDYTSLWQSIDSNPKFDYLKDIRSTLKSRQETIRALDTVEEWIEDLQLSTDEGYPNSYYSVDDLFKSHLKWMKSQYKERSAVSKNLFGRRMTSIYGKSKPISGIRCYSIPSRIEYSLNAGISPISESANPDIML
ncbi:virulence-associated E family protein [bacterium]|nr:virulence-associated E family protein [bacterium]